MRTALPLLLALLLALLPAACGGEPAPVPPWRGEGRLIEVTLDDLHCQGCAVTVENALAVVDGVETVRADHVSRLVLVTLAEEADREAAIPLLREAIHEAGQRVVGEDAAD